jgi:hypothetical protein
VPRAPAICMHVRMCARSGQSRRVFATIDQFVRSRACVRSMIGLDARSTSGRDSTKQDRVTDDEPRTKRTRGA